MFPARAHMDMLSQGYTVVPAEGLGLDPVAFGLQFGPALAPDPRGPGKLHARDVVNYRRTPFTIKVTAAQSIAFTGGGERRDDYSRFHLTAAPGVAQTLLRLVPPSLSRPAGAMSADYFRYSAGVESGAHRDAFGDVVIIWCLGRDGEGAENFLIRDGETVFHRVLAAGEVMVFRDDLFMHGISPLLGAGAWRDVLVCITLLDPA